ncbi:MAG: phosphate ABC transporter substrate-binding protein PstS [Corynebacterium sp.]|nr:phosphate ABC transporter substrate-binding protein PstS [Corynebacterium sp.]
MIRNFKRSAAVIGVVAASSAALVACSNSSDQASNGSDSSAKGSSESSVELPGGYTLSGATGGLVAEGASSQQNAMDYFGAKFQEVTNGDSYLEYNPTGSGSGRTNFVAGQVVFAGSDSPLAEDQVEPAKKRCGGNEAWHLPFVIGPVAIAYNLEGVEKLNLTTQTVADIFSGKITTWNDPKIAAENAGVELPDTPISVVYRSDESGTSDNFQKFLKASTEGWTGEGTNFPATVGEGAQGSSGVATQVQQIDGGITYVEHSHAADSGLGIANIDFGNGPVEINEENVGSALDSLEFKTEGNNMVIDSAALYGSAEGYPLILTTYEIVCSGGYTEEEANLVKDFLMTALAHQDEGLAEAGHIPVTGSHYDRLVEAVNAISAG